MDVLIQVIISGISAGAVYGLFAICIGVLYRLTGIAHLAIGELAGLAVFTTILIAYGRESVAGTAPRVPEVVALAVALAATAAMGFLVYRVAVEPFLRRGFSVAWVGGIVAAAIAVRGAVRLIFPRDSYTFASWLPIRSLGTDGVISFGGGATVQARAVVAGIVALSLSVATGWLLQRSKHGMALRAISEDRLGASLSGIPVERLLGTAFAGAALLVGAIASISLAGTAVGLDTTSVLGLKGLVAAVAARFGSPLRIVVVSLLLGVVETSIAALDVGSVELGPSFSEVIPIAVAILLLAAWGERTALQERS